MAQIMRLLTRADAAKYCRLSVTVFSRVCPVRPIELESGNQRLLRFDVQDLDKWIDDLKKAANGLEESTELGPDD
jgi:hypothetical protein